METGDGESAPLKKTRQTAPKFLRTSDSALAAPHFFSPKHVRFLEAYAETLDFKAACAAAEMRPAQVTRNPYLVNEVRLINRNLSFKYRSKTALGNHWRLMEMVEAAMVYGGQEIQRTAMSTLARMSEAAMRASGDFGDDAQVTGIQGVQVVINIGGAPPQEPPAIDVEATSVDG